MNNLLFVMLLGALLNPLIWRLGRLLPGERWQFLASFPRRPLPAGGWEGVNLTFYGFIIAIAGLLAVALFIVLLAALGLPPAGILLLVVVVLSGAVLASKLVARLVEKKKNTFTVAGGATVGLYLLPLLLWLLERHPPLWSFFSGGSGGTASGFSGSALMLPLLAALATAFIIGEGLGRLACLSFGCCYGKPLNGLPPVSRRFWAPWATVYHGDCKKIVYAHRLAGAATIPVQLLTALLYVNTGVLATWLYLEGMFGAAFLVAAVTAMGWRVVAEMWRADYRGEGRISAYQLSNMVNIVFCLLLFWLLPVVGVAPHLPDGLAALWRPEILLLLLAVWLLLLGYFGLSRVTGARIDFYLHRDRI